MVECADEVLHLRHWPIAQVAFRAVLAGTIGIGVLLTPSAAAPTRNVVALEYVSLEPQVLADQIADVARRCWVGKDPAFAGFRFDRVEPRPEPKAFQLLFTDRPRNKATPPRHLRVLVGLSSMSGVVVIAEQEGVDVKEIVRRDADLLLRRRTVSC